MDTDLQPIAEKPRLTRKVNAFAGVCLSVHLTSICGFIVSTAVFRLETVDETVKYNKNVSRCCREL